MTEQDCVVASEFGFAAEAGRELMAELDTNKVGPALECPMCGENDSDYLEMSPENELVTCSRCGAVYDVAMSGDDTEDLDEDEQWAEDQHIDGGMIERGQY